MAYGMLNVQERMPTATLIGTVHDEALALTHKRHLRDDTLETFNKHLCDIPWAPGCPLEAEGYIAKRYSKE
jgi:hypothetical protein